MREILCTQCSADLYIFLISVELVILELYAIMVKLMLIIKLNFSDIYVFIIKSIMNFLNKGTSITHMLGK